MCKCVTRGVRKRKCDSVVKIVRDVDNRIIVSEKHNHKNESYTSEELERLVKSRKIVK